MCFLLMCMHRIREPAILILFMTIYAVHVQVHTGYVLCRALVELRYMAGYHANSTHLILTVVATVMS